MENKNLELWDRVQKTDPNHTKKANVKGNKIISIAPQYQILNATREFGVYGSTWGFKKIEIDNSLSIKGMVLFKGTFFFPKGEFEIISSVGIYKDNAQTKIDDDFAKKVETDALTKALSKLGFNADIFMGRYDDVKYLNEVTEEFKPKHKLDDNRFKAALEALSKGNTTKEDILKYSLTPSQKEQLNKA